MTRQPFTYFLSLWICLFWAFHVNGITQCVIFWLCLLSLSIRFQSSSMSSRVRSLHFCVPCLPPEGMLGLERSSEKLTCLIWPLLPRPLASTQQAFKDSIGGYRLATTRGHWNNKTTSRSCGPTSFFPI